MKIIKKRLSQIKTLISDIAYYFHKKYFEKIEVSDKVLYIDFKNPNLYHRFFYVLVKYYNLSGYSIFYPMNFSRFRNLMNGDRYLSLILKEKGTVQIKNIDKNKAIVITDSQFSADYFKTYFDDGNNTQGTFHVPMSFHPLMYHENVWNKEVKAKLLRINSLFCYGSFDEKAYTDIERTNFQLINRRKIFNFFQKLETFHVIKDQMDLDQILLEKRKGNYFFAEKATYAVGMEDVREIVSNFRYFLCCPGVVMPLCHNVIEAVSVGTVPVIQKKYAEVMYPNLEHMKNAVIFESLNDLQNILENLIFKIPDADYKEMSNNAFQYYENHLSPEKVTENINKNLNQSIIYLNAEHRSVKFL